MKSILLLFLIISIPQAQAEPNPVFCWLFSMQGCPGVDPVAGNAISTRNNGASGVGAIGGKTDRVETRTIIKVPDYKVRRFLRSLGLGGQRINISYDQNCDQSGGTLSPSTNALFNPASATECMRALLEDLNSSPQAINLQVVQCQERFCHADFIEVFEAFLKDHPEYHVPNVQNFLGCELRVIEV